MTKRILMVNTSADHINENEQTGIWLSEFGEPFTAFSNQGYEITIASVLGGQVPIDHRSLPGAPQSMLDTAQYLQHTVKLDAVGDLDAYDAMFIPGGHGTMFDMPDNDLLQSIIRSMYEAGKVVAAVCHGPAALVGVKLSDGTPLVAGKTIAAFTDEEERETTLDQWMPFLLETRLRELGAHIVPAPNWANNVQVDGNLITGQNPQSAERAAAEVIRYLNESGLIFAQLQTEEATTMTTTITTTELTSVQQVIKRWKMHRNALLELAALLPESSGDFRPWDGAYTMIELVHHLAWTPDFFFSAIETRDMIIPPVPATVSEARELLKQLTDEHERKLASYSEADLNKNATIPMFKVTEPIVEVLHRLIGHEAHHKGQLFVYTRMLGINPPFYVDLTV